uniref:Uncharacterized protein n=1 Tax=Strigamia maritima TaxID=126957 RepID=T1IJZ3_STRMM
MFIYNPLMYFPSLFLIFAYLSQPRIAVFWECNPGTITQCHPGDDCHYPAVCDGEKTQCPKPIQVADQKNCLHSPGICVNGHCIKSVCSKEGLIDCTCRSRNRQCFKCCLVKGECKTSKELDLHDSNGKLFVKPDFTPCGNDNGVCKNGLCIAPKLVERNFGYDHAYNGRKPEGNAIEMPRNENDEFLSNSASKILQNSKPIKRPVLFGDSDVPDKFPSVSVSRPPKRVPNRPVLFGDSDVPDKLPPPVGVPKPPKRVPKPPKRVANRPVLFGDSDDFNDDQKPTKRPPNRPVLFGDSDDFNDDDQKPTKRPPNRPVLFGDSDDSNDDQKPTKRPPNRPVLFGDTDDSNDDEKPTKRPPKRPMLFDDSYDPNEIQRPPKRPIRPPKRPIRPILFGDSDDLYDSDDQFTSASKPTQWPPKRPILFGDTTEDDFDEIKPVGVSRPPVLSDNGSAYNETSSEASLENDQTEDDRLTKQEVDEIYEDISFVTKISIATIVISAVALAICIGIVVGVSTLGFWLAYGPSLTSLSKLRFLH